MATIKIDGMTCGSCIETIKNALKELIDSNYFTIDLESGIAQFSADIDPNEILFAIKTVAILDETH